MNAYQRVARQTDRLAGEGLELPILGLFGEVGSLLSALKKRNRDGSSLDRYRSAVVEELGDTLWYFANVASRGGLELVVLAQRMFRDLEDWDEVEYGHEFGSFADIQAIQDGPISETEFNKRATDLAGCVGDLLNDFRRDAFHRNRDKLSAHLVEIFRAIISAADASGISLEDAALENLYKTYSRWPIDFTYPPKFNSTGKSYEEFPEKMEIFISEEDHAEKSYVIMRCNELIIGDRLTDNKQEFDDYRFHDVFHFAFAVHLGWSPVLRALLHLKRKSDSNLDENQDGARAIIIEEGVATFIFARGLELNLFSNVSQVEYDLLKAIKDLISGYEVERCALWQWERAILDGFRVFRSLKEHRKGILSVDLKNHSLTFSPA
ncbi:nucleoside triphosphate pyrophosphohydrolase family protein [Variovorax boronicumulans]|uniref:nucleoside triphosphate pyrophosphohydrolase family protein n=1 Tax=Variovorax boronicumulans TaxID=436515 RepID=UPI003399E64A